MSNYRRLISYIYAYEGGIKKKNVGFAKLEVRNGQCKIQVNVRNVYIGSQDTGVYLLSEAEEILVGKIFIRNGAGEFRAIVSVNNVAGSCHTIDQCYGLTVHNMADSWQSYTTIWEDAVAHAAEVALSEATSERIDGREECLPSEGRGGEIQTEETGGIGRTPIADAIEAEIEAQSQKEERMRQKLARERQEEEKRAREAQEKEKLARAAQAEEKRARESQAEEKRARESQAEEKRARENQAEKKQVQETADGNAAGRPEKGQETELGTALSSEIAPLAPPPRLPRPVDLETMEVKVEDSGKPEEKDREKRAEAGQDSKEAEKEKIEGRAVEEGSREKEAEISAPQTQAQVQPPRQARQFGQEQQTARPGTITQTEPGKLEDEPKIDVIWQHFYKSYPKIQAFDYKGGCDILTIKPQDIGLLPREVWGYGNNSFLLHGYYSHRYLIFARLNSQKGEPRFLLGVPGHYYSNEKYMASMFGFPNFVLSKIQPAGDGRFGYWYTDIRLG